MLENLTAMELMETMSTRQVSVLFRDSLSQRNVVVFATTFKVLAKRGDYATIQEEFISSLEEKSLTAGSGFSNVAFELFFQVRKASPILGRIGKKLARLEDGEEFGTKELKEALEEDALNTRLRLRIEPFITYDSDKPMDKAVFEQIIKGMTAMDLVMTKVDTWEQFRKFASKVNEELSDEQAVSNYLRSLLVDQIAEIEKEPLNKERMKLRIINDLGIKFE